MDTSTAQPRLSPEDIRDKIEPLRDMVISSCCLVGEIPGPTFQEGHRATFVLDRFRESGLDRISMDEAGNAFGILPGTDGTRNILAVAHLDTLFSERIDHTVSVTPDLVCGAGIADNSLGLAAVVSLPELLDRLDIRLRSNLVLMGSSKSLGRGNIAGLRYFLENRDIPIDAAVCVEGTELGRLSYSSLGILRGQIDCKIPDDEDMSRIGSGGAISILSQIVAGLEAIPLPGRPFTRIILGSCKAGVAFNTVARKASLRFEVQGEKIGMVSEIRDRISEVVDEIRLLTGAGLSLEEVARRSAGSIGFDHPMSQSIRGIMRRLDVEPVITPSVGDLSALVAENIPSVTLGISRRAELEKEESETVQIKPMATGLAQLISLLVEIDGEGANDS